jgi:hypothetical protein
MEYGEFVGRCGPRLRSVCSLVTVYGDDHDSALGISQLTNKMWFGLFPHDAPPGLAAETCGSEFVLVSWDV